MLERFRAKWTPVRVKKTRQIKNLELRFDSIETEKALASPVAGRRPCRCIVNDQRFRKGPAVTLRRLVAAIIVTVVSATAAQADPIVHRTAVAAGEAIATGGSFSIMFPIAYNDIELRAEDPPAPTLVVHLLTGLDSEGLRVSATEQTGPAGAGLIDGLMQSAEKRPGATVSEISRAQDGEVKSLSFALTEPKGGSYFRMIQSGRTLYILTMQFPEAIRERATHARDAYFGSFKLTRP
jgi:hypothetical protein